jgi:hypothetical protein
MQSVTNEPDELWKLNSLIPSCSALSFALSHRLIVHSSHTPLNRHVRISSLPNLAPCPFDLGI